MRLQEIGGWGIPSRWVCQHADSESTSGIKSLKGLEYAINLTELHLGRNHITDVSPLKDLTNLRFLDLGDNWRIADVSLLRNLTNLTFLNLRGNRITDVSPLKNMTRPHRA